MASDLRFFRSVERTGCGAPVENHPIWPNRHGGGTDTDAPAERWLRAAVAVSSTSHGTPTDINVTSADQPPSTTTPRLAVILCVHNGAPTIRRQLGALAAERWDQPFEVVIVDNRSTDATAEVVAEFIAEHPGTAGSARFRMVSAPDKPGLAHARNVGVSSTATPAVAFCDDDDLVGEGWVAAMGSALETHPLVACRFEWRRGPECDDRADSSPGGFQTNDIETLFGYPVVSGVGGWQRWLWDALGGNDESLDFTGEDFDMAIRAHLEYGVMPHFAENAVYHIATRANATVELPPSAQLRAFVRCCTNVTGVTGSTGRAAASVAHRGRGWRVTSSIGVGAAAKVLGAPAGMRVGRLEQSIRSRTLWS